MPCTNPADGAAPVKDSRTSTQRPTGMKCTTIRYTDQAAVVAIDPFVGGAMFGGSATKHIFLASIDAAGVAERIDLRQAKSIDLRPLWDQRIDLLLYIDGKHDYWTLSDDLRWTQHLNTGQHVLIHDAFSSIG
jgi:hypothetical protein